MSLFPPGKRVHVMDIFDLLIKPQETYDSCKVQNIVLVQDGTTDHPFPRLNWEVSTPVNRPAHLPYSAITGPFSYFGVSVGGTFVGRAHTLSYVFEPDTVKSLKIAANANVKIAIMGTVFGRTVSETVK